MKTRLCIGFLFSAGCLLSPALAADADASASIALKAPARSINDVTAVLEQYKPDAEKVGRLRAILKEQPPVSTNEADIVNFYRRRARAALELGAVAEEIAALQKLMTLDQDEDRLRTIQELVNAEHTGGNLLNAIEVSKQGLIMAREAGRKRGHLLARQSSLAGMYAELGEFDISAQYFKDAEATYQFLLARNKQFHHAWRAVLERVRTRMLVSEGKLKDAEISARLALNEMELDRADNLQRLAQGAETPAQETVEKNIDADRLALARVLALQNRLAEAEVEVRTALKSALERSGRYSIIAAQALRSFTLVLLEQGRYADAEKMARLAIDTALQIGAAPDSTVILAGRQMLAQTLTGQERWQAALAVYAEIEDALARSGRKKGSPLKENAYVLSMVKSGQSAKLQQQLEQRIAEEATRLGEDNYAVAEGRGLLGMSYAASGRLNDALGQFRTAVGGLLDKSKNTEGYSPLKLQRRNTIVEAYIALLARIHGTAQESAAGINAAAVAFSLADSLHSQATQQALAASSVRATANDSQLAAVIRKEQDLEQESFALRRNLSDLLAAPPAQQLAKVMNDMRTRMNTIQKERQKLLGDIERQFPEFSNLVSPKAASIEQARHALREGEAIVSIIATSDSSYIWAFRKDGPVAFATSRLGQHDIEKIVTTLRASLTPEQDGRGGLPRFNLELSHKLYGELLAPVQAGWKSARNLYISSSGALSRLPFAVLVTSLPSSAQGKNSSADLQAMPWLIKEAAITQLPSVNTLVILRKMPSSPPGRETFIGFGDPEFSANANAARQGTRGFRKLGVGSAWRQVADSPGIIQFDYNLIPPLPDTRDELLSVAAALKADPARDLFFGKEASRDNFMRADLSKKKIVAFSTHGLLPGDIPGIDEPALALANPGNGEHGLLTLTNILRLKMDADWVVLSACNTAASDGSDADAISGLGRGFFFAGSRALLVTHWSVETVSARLLVTRLFSNFANDPKATRAESLRQSILTLMNTRLQDETMGTKDLSTYSHPMFWAPFSLVGDGDRS